MEKQTNKLAYTQKMHKNNAQAHTYTYCRFLNRFKCATHMHPHTTHIRAPCTRIYKHTYQAARTDPPSSIASNVPLTCTHTHNTNIHAHTQANISSSGDRSAASGGLSKLNAQVHTHKHTQTHTRQRRQIFLLNRECF